MRSINILNKEGFLTNEDRKQPLERGCEHITFKTCLDLTEPVEMRLYGNSGKITLKNYTNDIASFIVFWKHFVMKDLNGFSGFYNVEWKAIDFEIIN